MELIIPRIWFRKAKDIFSHYALKRIFTITQIPAVDFSFFPFFEYVTYPLRFIFFSKWAVFYCLWKYRKEKNTVVYFSHDAIPLFFLSFISKNIFYDIHDFPSHSLFARRVMAKARGFSVQTKVKIPFLKKHFGMSDRSIVYWPNGTDISQFTIDMPKNEARKQLSLPANKKIALYTGQLFLWKGVDTFIQASRFLPDVLFYVVGGSVRDVTRTKREINEAKNPNVHFISFQPHETMPAWLRAADVVVLPNTGREDISQYWTSPMKLFEYMASGTPIIASRLPSIEEILDDESAFFAEADNPKSFADAIQLIIDVPGTSIRKGENAQKKAFRYTWNARAKKIIEHIRALAV